MFLKGHIGAAFHSLGSWKHELLKLAFCDFQVFGTFCLFCYFQVFGIYWRALKYCICPELFKCCICPELFKCCICDQEIRGGDSHSNCSVPFAVPSFLFGNSPELYFKHTSLELFKCCICPELFKCCICDPEIRGGGRSLCFHMANLLSVTFFL